MTQDACRRCDLTPFIWSVLILLGCDHTDSVNISVEMSESASADSGVPETLHGVDLDDSGQSRDHSISEYEDPGSASVRLDAHRFEPGDLVATPEAMLDPACGGNLNGYACYWQRGGPTAGAAGTYSWRVDCEDNAVMSGGCYTGRLHLIRMGREHFHEELFAPSSLEPAALDTDLRALDAA
jgi:hypothetical protein